MTHGAVSERYDEVAPVRRILLSRGVEYLEKMKFLYTKDNENFGFTIEAPTAEKCFELGIEEIEKAAGELLNYYSVDEFGLKTNTAI